MSLTFLLQLDHPPDSYRDCLTTLSFSHIAQIGGEIRIRRTAEVMIRKISIGIQHLKIRFQCQNDIAPLELFI
jgi:hypothetical protein